MTAQLLKHSSLLCFLYSKKLVLGFQKAPTEQGKSFDAILNYHYSTDCMWYSASVTLHVKFNAVIYEEDRKSGCFLL